MMRFLKNLTFGALFLGLAGSSFAEDKIEKMTSDQTQEKYTRKSITYVGISAQGVNIPADNLGLAETEIRKLIELPRFDYNSVSLTNKTLDQFVQELREFVKKASMDRAGAEAEFEDRFKSARVYAKDIDRIMSSAYLYNITVVLFNEAPFTCPWDKAAALLQKCTPGQAGIKVKLNATVTFNKANLLDEKAPPYTLLKTIQVMPNDGFQPFESPPTPPVVGAAKAIFEAYERALADYNRRLPQIQHDASLKATKEAASSLAQWLSKDMKKIPDFQLKTPVSGAQPDGVEFMLGKNEGVGYDDTYDVTEFDAAGTKSNLGYVKVRTIGDAKGTGEGSPSYAEKVKEKKNILGGEMLYEHPMIGLAIGIHGVFEFVMKDVLGQTDSNGDKKTGFYPGLGLYIDKDISNVFKSPEWYASVEADVLFLPEVDTIIGAQSTKLVHGMLGLKKKWYAKSLVFSLGARAGISYYIISFDSGADYEGDSLGFGGDVIAGLEYYVIPEFSVYLKAAGRFFTNPGVDADPEMGINGSLGVFVAF
jgi:hypothetical protein